MLKKKWISTKNMRNDAVSEIIGTVVLLAVAVASFSVLYVTLSATLVTEESPQVNLIGYIEGNDIVLEHQGGDTLKDNTKIDFVIGGTSHSFTLMSSNANFSFYDNNNNGEWDVGEKIAYSSESVSGLSVESSIVDTASNSALFIGSLQDGISNASSIVDLSTFVEMIPFYIDSSPHQINATGSNLLDNVKLYYAFSSSNWTSCSNQTLSYDDFEDGFGNFTSGGSNCDIDSGGSYAHQGNNAIHIQNSGDAASFYLTESVDIDSTSYSTLTVDFWFIKNANPGASRQFTIDYYDGSDWQTIFTYSLSDYNNDEFYHEQVWINETDYTFPSDMNIRFKGAMPNNNDDVYFDQIYINASCDGSSSSNEPVWMQFATDMSNPWSWDFSFSNGTGYYQFYSIGEHDARVEPAPSTADAFCYYNTSTSSNQISIWHFDENTGSIAYDSADGNDGNIYGATWTTGKDESGLNFDGTQQEYVTIPFDNSIALDHNYSVAFWIYPTDETVQWRTFLTRPDQFTCSYIGNDEIRVHVNGYANIDSQTSAPRNSWTHVVFTFENSEVGDDKIIIYMNGESDGQVGPTWGTPNTPTNSLILGGDASSSYFTGSLDEIIIYDKALSADEVSTLYSQYD